MSNIGCQMTDVRKKGFTLLELLITIAILAILISMVVFLLNPAEILRKSRDAQRLSDMTTLRAALGLYVVSTNQPKLDNAVNSDTYCAGGTGSDLIWVSYPSDSPGAVITDLPPVGSAFVAFKQVSNTDIYKVDGSGWIPTPLDSIKGGAPISNLPVDPVNRVNSVSNITNLDLIYRYACRTGLASTKPHTFEINGRLESEFYGESGEDDKAAKDGGNNAKLFEVGSNLTILPDTNDF
ncbi:TPA: hypothetical protein DCP13_03715 [Candidatus Azambacteria bacterium]|nr:hypothetical protein [Candidatus Azambacteria bacterium]HAQ05870.1 hypothetical protein [Candidatus Azambacteria bacterium]HBA52593.1 hypothetical protein [Candidatus Azambacteria bacterium]